MPTDVPAEKANMKQITPEVSWAQRSSSSEEEKNFVYITISVPDVPTSDMKLDMQPSNITFTGHSDTKKATYHVELELFEEIDPEKSKVKHSARDVELKLQKKELKEEYWPRLLKSKDKAHFLHTDFDKWVDEDEQDGVPDDDYMNNFGGGAGGGMGGDGGFGGLDFSKLGGGAGGMPDLSALSGMEGMGGMGAGMGGMGAGMGGMGAGMGGMGAGMGGEGDDSDDDEMPELEDEEGESKDEEAKDEASSSSAGAKIEEVK